MGVARGPDFIVMGARKSATTWMYSYARRSPHMAMPDVKEMNFFLQSELWQVDDVSGFVDSLVNKWLARHAPRAAAINAVAPPRDGPMTLQQALTWYSTMFDNVRNGGDARSGDISPLYQNLSAARVARIAAEFPDTRVIYVLREPTSRLWSDFVMEFVKNRGLDVPAATSTDILWKLLGRSIRGGLYSEVYEQWLTAFGDRLSVMFFDDLVADSENFASQFCANVGAEYSPGFADATKNPNPGMKVECPSFVRDELQALMVPELLQLQAALGTGTPIDRWLASYDRAN